MEAVTSLRNSLAMLMMPIPDEVIDREDLSFARDFIEGVDIFPTGKDENGDFLFQVRVPSTDEEGVRSDKFTDPFDGPRTISEISMYLFGVFHGVRAMQKGSIRPAMGEVPIKQNGDGILCTNGEGLLRTVQVYSDLAGRFRSEFQSFCKSRGESK